MPVYEYQCARCGERFSLLQPMSAPREGNACPRCGARQTRRLISSFSTTQTGSSPSSACGPGSGFG